jgi:CRISPR/Cas system-associated exonuclease Cas4 (RecB family)
VDDNGFATRGNVMEDAFTAPLLRAWCKSLGGELLWSGQADQKPLVGKGVALSATPDGLAINMPRDCLAQWGVADIGPSQCFLMEMKSISPRYRKENLPKAQHVPQTLAQIGMIRAGTKYKPDGGVVVYVDADDYYDIRMYPVAWDEKAFKSLVKRADLIMKTKDADKVPPEGKMRGGSDCSECPFARRCLGYVPYTFEDTKALPAKEVAKVEKVAAKVKALELEVEAKKKALSEAEGDLILTLGKVKRNFVKGAKFTTHLKKTASQNRKNLKLLEDLARKKGATDKDIEACVVPTKEGVSLSVELVN